MKPFLGLCAGVALLLFFLVLGILALAKDELVLCLLYAGIGCSIFMVSVLYLIVASCRRRDKRDNIISCRNCGSAFVQLAQNAEICPDCGSDSLLVVE